MADQDAWDQIANPIAIAAEHLQNCTVEKMMDDVSGQMSFESRDYLLNRVVALNAEHRKEDSSLPSLTLNLWSEREIPVIHMDLKTSSQSIGERLKGVIPDSGGHYIYAEVMNFNSLTRGRHDFCKD